MKTLRDRGAIMIDGIRIRYRSWEEYGYLTGAFSGTKDGEDYAVFRDPQLDGAPYALFRLNGGWQWVRQLSADESQCAAIIAEVRRASI